MKDAFAILAWRQSAGAQRQVWSNHDLSVECSAEEQQFQAGGVARKRQEAMDRVREREREERQRAREVARQKEIAERCCLAIICLTQVEKRQRALEVASHGNFFAFQDAVERQDAHGCRHRMPKHAVFRFVLRLLSWLFSMIH